MKRSRSAGLAIVGALLLAPISPLAANAATCVDYVIVGARGTTEDPRPFEENLADDPNLGMGAIPYAAANKLKTILESHGKTVDLVGVNYPANSVGWIVPFVRGPLDDYYDSVDAGADEFARQVEDELCSAGAVNGIGDSEAIFVGYSQGSQALGPGVRALSEEDRSRIAGVMNFGSPIFNGRDKKAGFSTFDPTRSGFFGKHPKWETLIDAPVVDTCHKFDQWCQARVEQRVDGRITTALDLDTIRNEVGFPLDREHTNYDDKGDPELTACELASRMGFQSGLCNDGSSRLYRSNLLTDGGVDVALLVDTTQSSGGVLPELQARVDDILNRASHGASGTRYAVIGYSSSGIVNATGGFTTSVADAAGAVRDLSVSQGSYGAIYAAINAANALDWRANSRKIALTMATSRACPYQYCDYDSSGANGDDTLGYVNTGEGLNIRRAGVYTREHQYFFEVAGWAQAMDERYTSRPQPHHSSEGWIDELESNFSEAVLAEDDNPIAGTTNTIVGDGGAFRADEAIPYYADSPARRLTWSVERTGDVVPLPDPGDDGGGVTISSREAFDEGLAQSMAEAGEGDPGSSQSDPEGAEPEPLPEDQGPLFEPEFTESGMYKVTLTAYLDGTVETFEQTVRVADLPEAPPAAPLLASTINDGVQTLRWSEGDGERATAYGLIASDGSTEDVFIPEMVEDDNGVPKLQVQAALDDGAPYSLVAYNEIASTPAIGVISADAATYSHVSADGGTPTGGVLELGGEVTPELLAAVGGTADGVERTLAGDYTATFTSPGGDSFPVNMAAVPASVTVGSAWTAEFDLREVTTTANVPLADLLDDGLAEELFAGGHIDLKIGDNPIRVEIDPLAETVELDEFIIDSNSPAPTGNVATDVFGDSATLTLTDSANAPTLRFLADAADPMQDWTGAAITDIRTWIGSTEVSNTLTGTPLNVVGDAAPESVTVSFNGQVVGGTPNLMRDFLTTGTVSFSVNGGAPTVMHLQVSEEQATGMYPDVDAPALLGRSTVTATQYGQELIWKAVVEWGTSNFWDRTIYLDGDLPAGVYWDTNGYFNGLPTQSGTYPFTLTAVSDTGQSTKSYVLRVDPSSATPTTVTGTGYHYTYEEDGSQEFSIQADGYFRPDNPAYAGTLPITQQLAADGYVSMDLTDVIFKDPSGQALPVTGNVHLEMATGWYGTDSLWLTAYPLTRTDGSQAPVADLFGAGGSVTFFDLAGNENTVAFKRG